MPHQASVLLPPGFLPNAARELSSFLDPGRNWRSSQGTFHYILNLNVVGPLAAMQQAIPIMRKLSGGAIINISSGLALMHLPNMCAYSASKRALANISLTAREELKKDNIIVSVVYPYITLTDFENNTISEPANDSSKGAGNAPFPPDSAEFVANRILKALKAARQRSLRMIG